MSSSREVAIVVAGYALQGVGAVLAWRIAARLSYHRPAAWFLAAYAVADVARAVAALLVLEIAPRPFVGGARVVFHVDQALFVLQPIALLALALRVWPDRSTRHLWGAAALLVAYLVVAYPGLRGDPLGRVYLVVHVVCLAAAWGCFGWWCWRRPGRWPTWTEGITLVWIAADTALLAGPWARRVFVDWPDGDVTRLERDLVTCGFQVAWIRAMPALRPRLPEAGAASE